MIGLGVFYLALALFGSSDAHGLGEIPGSSFPVISAIANIVPGFITFWALQQPKFLEALDQRYIDRLEAKIKAAE